jgi:hypothetical protein
LFECTRDGQWRTVTIRRDAQATPPACDVRYQKRTELFDHDQVLWRGANGLTFCRERATALTAKLTGWGWQYVGGAPSTVADDTDFRAIEPAPNDSTWVGQPANSSTVLRRLSTVAIAPVHSEPVHLKRLLPNPAQTSMLRLLSFRKRLSKPTQNGYAQVWRSLIGVPWSGH